MTCRMAFLAAAACMAALPQAATAADYPDAGRAAGFARDDDGADAGRFDRGPAFHPADRRGPGPVVFDARDPDRLRMRFGDGGPSDADVGPVPFGRPPFGRDGFIGPEGADGWPARPRLGYRAVAVPLEVEGLAPGVGRPDVGCTTEQSETVTPAGWRKIVTHRTCYRR